MNNNEQLTEVIETPSSAFSDLSDDLKKEIEELAEEWKSKPTGGIKSDFTSKVKSKYKDIPRAYEYFVCLKTCRKDQPMKKTRKARNPEAVAREEFAQLLRYFLKKYFKNNCNIDQDSKVFLLDSNYNLPSYFWTRMNLNVLPKITTLSEDKKTIQLRAWLIAVGIMKKYETELGDRLQKTQFSDLKHVSNTIIQFLNKYMLTTYQELMKKARQQVIDKKKNEQKLNNESNNNTEVKIKKRGGGTKEVQSIGFDTNGLL